MAHYSAAADRWSEQGALHCTAFQLALALRSSTAGMCWLILERQNSTKRLRLVMRSGEWGSGPGRGHVAAAAVRHKMLRDAAMSHHTKAGGPGGATRPPVPACTALGFHA